MTPGVGWRSQLHLLCRRAYAGRGRGMLRVLPMIGLAAAAVLVFLRASSELRCALARPGESGSSSAEVRESPAATRRQAATEEGSLRDGVTLVTGYWNIGEIPKQDESNRKHPDLYYGWLRFFANIQNPVVGYFDDAKAAAIFKEARQGLPSEVIMTNRNAMWSFRLAGRIKEIVDRPDYPKWVPNTVYPLYSCAMHAKFESMKQACQRNYFRTRHVAWLDVGEFRDLAQAGDRSPFYIGVPPGHDDNLVAFDEVRPLLNLSVERIMKDSPVWVCGCFFLARVSVMEAFADEYVRYTEKFLDDGLANVDQNVIMAMYTGQNADRPKVGIQVYPYDPRYDRWFSLGYLLRERSLAEHGLSAAKKLY